MFLKHSTYLTPNKYLINFSCITIVVNIIIILCNYYIYRLIISWKWIDGMGGWEGGQKDKNRNT